MQFIELSILGGITSGVPIQNISHLMGYNGYTAIVMKSVCPELATINVKETPEQIEKLIAEKQ